ADEDKFGWPKRAIGIRRDPTSFHGSGAGLHCLVDEIQIANPRRNRTIREVGFYFYIRTAEIFSHERKIVLGHGEIGINRIESLDRDKRWSRRPNQVANVNIAQTHSSVDRGFYVAPVEVHLSSLGRCLGLLCVRHSRVVVLLRYDLSRAQVLLSFQRHLIQLRLRFRLVESGLKWAGVDCEKQIAFLQVGAILEMASDDYATDLRLHLHSFVGGACPDFIEVKRHIFCDDFGYGHRTHWGLGLP